MAKAQKIKSQAAATVPQTREEVVESIAEIGRLDRERRRIETLMNDELAAIRQKYESEAASHVERIVELSQGVQVWCEAHRADLTLGKTKTVNLASGEVSWRLNPPKVNIRNEPLVIEALKLVGLDRMIRKKEEINKEAILSDREAVKNIKGISITQKEEFIITPFETELQEAGI